MKNQGFIEILPGIWYEEATGLPWSSKEKIDCCGTYNYNGDLKKLNTINDGYYKISKGKMWHRVVYEYFKGTIPKDMRVDHKDNNRINNLIDNLQLLTIKKNSQKCLKAKNNTSGYAGVSFRKDNSKYKASISINSKRISLGCFSTPEEAYEVYLQAKIKYHGADSISPLINK